MPDRTHSKVSAELNSAFTDNSFDFAMFFLPLPLFAIKGERNFEPSRVLGRRDPSHKNFPHALPLVYYDIFYSCRIPYSIYMMPVPNFISKTMVSHFVRARDGSEPCFSIPTPPLLTFNT